MWLRPERQERLSDGFRKMELRKNLGMSQDCLLGLGSDSWVAEKSPQQVWGERNSVLGSWYPRDIQGEVSRRQLGTPRAVVQ